ncbi:MAG TPA: HDIG domain-containing protein [Rubricoccaceae bacterium]|nr:HDIG domain-containing protein [Rubricoccaceae bacterium]
MAILERIGLAPKRGRRPRWSGLKLEGRSAQAQERLSRRAVWARVGLLAGLVGLTLLAFPRVRFYENTAKIGDVWLSEDLVAPFNFPIRLTEPELEAKRDSIRLTEPPIFAGRDDAREETLARLDTLDARLEAVFEAYGAWQRGLTRGQDAAAVAADSLRYARLREAMPVSISADQWDALLTSYAARAGLPTPSRDEAAGPPLDTRVFGAVQALYDPDDGVLARPVMDVPKDSVRAPEVVVRNPDPRIRDERHVPRDEVLGVDEAFSLARNAFERAFEGRRDSVLLALSVFRYAFVPSLEYLAQDTEQRLREQMEDIRPTRGLVRQGMTIVRRGDEVTPEVYEQLVSLEYAQRDRSGDLSVYRTTLGKLILVLAAYLVFFLYLYLLRRQIYADTPAMAMIALLFAGTVALYWLVGYIDVINELAVPVALVSVLLTVVHDSRVGLFATVTIALVGGLVFGFDFEFVFATVFAGFVGVFSVRDVKNRSDLVLSAGLVVVAYLVIGMGLTLMRATPFEDRFFMDLRSVLVNGVLLLLASPILWGLERGFRVTTDLALLELSDTNRPLLKELSLRAPGTFNHSLQVANLAEAAADAVGANALRARVGALYHDIGKMLKPEYFIENQQPGENPHDRITPYMSALIIASHVKDGLELGREHHLPQVVLDFIPTHHGTTMMEFFYRRAMEQQGENDPPVDEAEFRYPGPRPSTAEQAIVMLADSVEAASRSLDKPTPRRLEALIDAIFRARTEDGQLGGSPITFADLSRIKETFLSILCGIYHFRVKYPEQEGEPAEEALPPQEDERLALDRGAGLDVQVPDRQVQGGDGDSLAPASGPSTRERSSMG